eukprot:9399658-Pyramimonas_sp.AAC.1
MEQLEHVLGTYSSSAGLGWDKLHPRQLLWLPSSYRRAFLDILVAWERLPRSVDLWLLLVFFNSKPQPPGGVRPIVLLPLWCRVWSRLRQPVARRWERSLDNPAFWGNAGHACDRSGHVHNILQRFARLKGFSATSG